MIVVTYTADDSIAAPYLIYRISEDRLVSNPSLLDIINYFLSCRFGIKPVAKIISITFEMTGDLQKMAARIIELDRGLPGHTVTHIE